MRQLSTLAAIWTAFALIGSLTPAAAQSVRPTELARGAAQGLPAGLHLYRDRASLAGSPFAKFVPASVAWDQQQVVVLVDEARRPSFLGGGLAEDGSLALRWSGPSSEAGGFVAASLPRWDAPVRAEPYANASFSSLRLEIRGADQRWELWPTGLVRLSEAGRPLWTVALTPQEFATLNTKVSALELGAGLTRFGESAGLDPDLARSSRVDLQYALPAGERRRAVGPAATVDEVSGLLPLLWSLQQVQPTLEARAQRARSVTWARVSPDRRSLTLADGRALRVDRPGLLRNYEGRRIQLQGRAKGDEVELARVLAPLPETFRGRVVSSDPKRDPLYLDLGRSGSEPILLEGELLSLLRDHPGRPVVEGLLFEEPSGAVLRVTGVSAFARTSTRPFPLAPRLKPNQHVMIRGLAWGQRALVQSGPKRGYVQLSSLDLGRSPRSGLVEALESK